MLFFEALYTIVHAEIQTDLLEFLNNKDMSKDIFTDEPFINMKFNTSIGKTVGTKYNLYNGELGLDIIIKIFFETLNDTYILECTNYNDVVCTSFTTSSWTEIKKYVYEIFNEDINLSVYTSM